MPSSLRRARLLTLSGKPERPATCAGIGLVRISGETTGTTTTGLGHLER